MSLAIAVATLALAAFAPVDDVAGWGPGHVAADDLLVVAVADRVGGRALRFDLGGRALLWLDPSVAGQRWNADLDDPEAQWRYLDVGGFRCWPAPQSAWKRADDPIRDWPPPPRLDHGAFACRPDGDALHCHGPAEIDPRWRCTGLRWSHVYAIAPGTTRMTVTTTMTNLAPYPQRWAIWDVTALRVPTSAAADRAPTVLWPLRADSRFADGVMRQSGAVAAVADRARGVVRLRTDGIGGKVAGDPDRGWLMLYDPGERPGDGVVYLKRFAHDAAAWRSLRYPEGGCTVAVCTSPERGNVELEAMAPEVILDPGAATTFAVEWSACRVDDEPCDVVDVGVVVRPLRARRDAGRLRVTGSFGLSERGAVSVRIVDGPRLADIAATPLAPLVLDIAADDAPGDTVVIELGGRTIASAPIE